MSFNLSDISETVSGNVCSVYGFQSKYAPDANDLLLSRGLINDFSQDFEYDLYAELERMAELVLVPVRR